MRKLLICQLEPDMVLAETVFAPDNRVLLAEGTLLTENLIKRLDKMEISEICVNDEDTISIDPDQVLINRVYTMALQVLDYFLPANIVGQRMGEARERYIIVANVLGMVIKDKQVGSLYLDLRAADDDTLDHSIAVCVLSLILGSVFKMPESRLMQLGKAAMVHDIGKKAISQEILAKRENLTPQEKKSFQEHTREGYRILREQGFDPAIARVALYHHERWDGSGYINKVSEENIDLLSRIVAVADTYDDLTRGLTYKQKYLPHEAMEFLYGTGNIYYDARVIKAFTGNICTYPLGSIVKLSTGETGIVVNVQKTMAPRPIIKIFYDSKNVHLEYPKQVDLSEEKTIFITKIL